MNGQFRLGIEGNSMSNCGFTCFLGMLWVLFLVLRENRILGGFLHIYFDATGMLWMRWSLLSVFPG